MHFLPLFSTDGPWDPRCPELEGGDCRNDKLSVNPKFVRDLLLHLDVCKSMGPDGTHPRVLRELAGVVVGPLSVIFQLSWEPGEPIGSCQMWFQFSRRVRKKILAITGR